MVIQKKLIKYNFSPNNKPVYIVIHNTDNSSATALNHFTYWNGDNRGSSAHYVVDDKTIIQLVEHNNQSWHAGKKYISKPVIAKCDNSNSIGIEVCNAKQMDFDKCMDNTIFLVKKLMKDLKIPIQNVITHKDCTGKQCPSTILKLDKWNWFKEQLTGGDTIKTETVTINLNGVIKKVEAINVDGNNFIKLQDLRDDKIDVGYDSKAKMPTITVKDAKKDMELLGDFEITFYDDCEKCQGRWQGQTASGKPPVAGECIAVDTNVIPMYTKVYIEGIGERIALDRGGAIQGNKIDVLVGSHAEAMKKGRLKNVKVYKVVK